MAAAEGVEVVGINDFYSLDGYREWNDECAARHLYPMFNIEFISLNSEDQAAGLRVNDPNNPGRTYLSGKGLAYPVILSGKEAQMLADVRAESNAQVERMCAKLNAHLDEVKAGFNVDFKYIVKELTRGSVRERHLAKALRMAVDAKADKIQDRLALYERIFGGQPLKSAPDNEAAVENEIRSKLLKAGGAAFVPEDPKAFLPMETVCQIIKAAGGIPTYPFLADDAKGNFTDFEGDLQKAADTLKSAESSPWNSSRPATRRPCLRNIPVTFRTRASSSLSARSTTLRRWSRSVCAHATTPKGSARSCVRPTTVEPARWPHTRLG